MACTKTITPSHDVNCQPPCLLLALVSRPGYRRQEGAARPQGAKAEMMEMSEAGFWSMQMDPVRGSEGARGGEPGREHRTHTQGAAHTGRDQCDGLDGREGPPHLRSGTIRSAPGPDQRATD